MSLRMHASVPERGVEVELEVADGETLALVGPNGAGKSTALSLLGGLLRPQDALIELDGQVLTRFHDGRQQVQVPPHARHITTLAQDPVLFPHLSVLANVMFGLRAQGVAVRQARIDAAHWLEQTGLTPFAGRRPSQLSGGQAQRVAIARALAARPRLLLLDEPMAALDIDVAPALRELLRRFLVERSAIVVTHDVLDALTFAGRMAVMETGRVAEQGDTLSVLARPRSAFAARFAGLNLLRGTWDGGGVALPGGERIVVSGSRDLPQGAAVLACFRPSAVQLSPSAGHGGQGALTVLQRRVSALEPFADRVRVRAGDIAAEAGTEQVSAGRLVPGHELRLGIPAEAVTVYPASPSPHERAVP